MNRFMNALVKTMFKIGKVTFGILCLVWTAACTLIEFVALIPAALMDFINRHRKPWEKQFGVVGVTYMATTCMIVPLRFVGWTNKAVEDYYKVICEDYKNGL